MAIRMGMLLVLLAVGIASATDLTLEMMPSADWLTGDCNGGTLTQNVCVRTGLDESDEGVEYTNEAVIRFNLTSAGGSAPTYAAYTVETKTRQGGYFSTNFGTVDKLVVNLNAPSGKAFKLDLAKVKLMTFKLFLVQETRCATMTETKLAASAMSVKAGDVTTTVLSGVDEHMWWGDYMNVAGIGHVVVFNGVVVKPQATTGTHEVDSIQISITLPSAKACNSVQQYRWLGQGFELSIGSNAVGGVTVVDASSGPSGDDSTSSGSMVSYALMSLLAMLAVAFSAL